MHEHSRWGGEGIGEADKYCSHFKRCLHYCPHNESVVGPLRMSEVFNHVRCFWMFTKRDFLRGEDAHHL
ncbi:hypothetical protein Y032_0569g72 [Ancylostoma ceylanicum]|uniref:Uncharacterized protein n=1 Tax=Ancylostoma ceylanicum TaxID=53326 RepID=A0A016WQW2_9BILA|nr:hypothetical protein Y032_0569g72 [Ancylostoma ceylanicum]